MHTPENVFSKFSSLKDFDVTDVNQLKILFEELLAMDLSTPEGIETYLRKRDIIEKHYENEAGESYFLKTTDVANEKWKQRREHYDQVVAPLCNIYEEKLNKKFLASSEAQRLPVPFDVLRRNWKSEVELFFPQNVELQKQMDSICSEITEIQGKLTAKWQGEDVPLPFLYEQMQKTDRSIRKEAYGAMMDAKCTLVDVLDEKYNKLLELRQKIAENAGYDSYTDYRFREIKRFDWGPPECFEFHRAVKKHLLPLGKGLLERRKKGLNLDSLRPYDGACDPNGREPLLIYEKGKSNQLIDGTERIIQAIDSELHGYFIKIRDDGLLDLDARKNKAQIAYMCSYPVYEQASVFMEGTGLSHDLMTLLHELGHCFHYFLSKDIQPHSLQSWTAEVAEVGSMTMELMGLEEMEHFLPGEQVDIIRETQLRSVVGLTQFTSKCDEFQHWIYANPGHSVDDRRQKWLELNELYSPGFNRDGYQEEIGKTGWQFYHILQRPFYMIDYSISNILALTLWDRYKKDPDDALYHYKRGCSLAGSRTVPEIYEAFGSIFCFGEEVIAPLARRLRAELNLDACM